MSGGRRLEQMCKIIRGIDKFLLFFVALTIAGSAIGCEWFSESTFELASESRLPKWIPLPQGLTRVDVSITMSYYVKPWCSSVTFILQETKRQIRTNVDGNVKSSEPFQLKQPPHGIPSVYPIYEV